MSAWQESLSRGDSMVAWSPGRAARQAVAWRYAFAHWLTSDQAALMRYVPEQQQALGWWAATRGDERADISEVMPAWLSTFYGLDTTDLNVDADDSLSLTARRIGRLCELRSHQIRSAAPAVVDPTSQSALLAMVDTDRYRGPDAKALAALPATGLLVFPHPILRTGKVEGPTLLAEPASPSPLRAICWVREDTAQGPAIRVLDLADMSGQWGRTGDAAFDSQVRQQLAAADQQLPPLMFHGEVAVVAAVADGPQQAQRALVSASKERRGRQASAWSPEAALVDEDGLLASRTLSVFAHAVTAPLLEGSEKTVPTPGSSDHSGADGVTEVKVYCRPRGSVS